MELAFATMDDPPKMMGYAVFSSFDARPLMCQYSVPHHKPVLSLRRRASN